MAGQLEQIIDLMQLMQQFAVDGDWEQVKQYDLKRQLLLQEFHPDKIQGSASQLTHHVQRIRELDRSILDLATAEKQRTGKALSKLQKQHNQCAQYLQAEA